MNTIMRDASDQKNLHWRSTSDRLSASTDQRCNSSLPNAGHCDSFARKKVHADFFLAGENARSPYQALPREHHQVDNVQPPESTMDAAVIEPCSAFESSSTYDDFDIDLSILLEDDINDDKLKNIDEKELKKIEPEEGNKMSDSNVLVDPQVFQKDARVNSDGVVLNLAMGGSRTPELDSTSMEYHRISPITCHPITPPEVPKPALVHPDCYAPPVQHRPLMNPAWSNRGRQRYGPPPRNRPYRRHKPYPRQISRVSGPVRPVPRKFQPHPAAVAHPGSSPPIKEQVPVKLYLHPEPRRVSFNDGKRENPKFKSEAKPAQSRATFGVQRQVPRSKRPLPPSRRNAPSSIRHEINAMNRRLMQCMSKSASSLSALQDWDKKHGLPKSHSPTMVNTSRSRKQLQEGKILPKWNGMPLIRSKTPTVKSH